MGRKQKIIEETMPTMKHPCCDRAWITYPYLNEIVCINCGTFRVVLPKHLVRIKKERKKRKVEKTNIDNYE